MLPVLASVVDFVHAMLMAAWVLGLPLLFWHKHPRATRWYATYAVSFIVLYQGSRIFLGECFLTSLSRLLWESGGARPASSPNEWFTVRVAMAIFHLAPSHHAVTIARQILIFATAVGMLVSMRRHRTARRAPG